MGGRKLVFSLDRSSVAIAADGNAYRSAYYHNAVLYSRLFRFLSPRHEGRLDALRRDLAGLSVAEASWAVDEGRVVEEPGGKVLRWRPTEMVAPLTRALKAYMTSEEYRAAVTAARDAVRYRVQPPRAK